MMKLTHRVFGSLLLLLAAGPVGHSGDRSDKPREEPKEQTQENYDSKTKGALQVKSVTGKSGDWFMVFQNGKQLVPPGKPLLDKTVELAPGDYVVRVNATERKVSVRTGKKTTLLTGELVVEAAKGTPGWYIPYVGKDKKLASNPPVLNSPISLFAGKYTVIWYEGGVGKREDLGQVQVKAGQRSVLKNQRQNGM
jgi:hypothetical protein